MRHFILPPLFRRAAALVLAAILITPTVYADAGEEKLRTSVELTDGLTYHNTITVNRSSRLESYALELEPYSGIAPILLQSSGTIYGAATINRAVSTAQAMGYQVLGAINTDFFSITHGVPMGIVIEDGVYKSSAGTSAAICIADGEVSLCETPQISLTLINLRDEAALVPNHFNKWRSPTGGLYLLNRNFSSVSTRTTSSGWYVRMRVIREPDTPVPALTVNSELELEVIELLQTDQAISIGEDEYILTADDASNLRSVYESFQIGDRIRLTTQCDGKRLSSAQWASGVGDVMILDGELTDSSNWTYIQDGRAPRSALGLKQDGTLLLYAADGRQSGHSLGLTQMDLAKELLKQGCEWAVNLDGGGSTSMSVWLPGQSGPALQNSPSDGKARSCATFLLLVTEDAGSGQADRLALNEDGMVVFAGSSLALPKAAALDNGLNILAPAVSDLTVTSRYDLGMVQNGIYTAGSQTGTDTLRLRSRQLDITGSAQIHVVDTLTALTISRAGSTAPLTSLPVEPGEQVQLAVNGAYWNRTALRDFSTVTWTVEGGIGTVDSTGLFTASESGGTGTLTAHAGGQSHAITVRMSNIHRDVPAGHWAYDAVEYCYQNGIVSGISPVEYGRDRSIRRADFVLMLYNAAGRPTPAAPCDFIDVAASDYYYTALSWAYHAGLISGTGEGTFSPNANITREQAFTILRLAMPHLGKECPDAGLVVLEPFADKDTIAPYAQRHTATLVAQGVVSGKGSGIDPQGQLTRAEMAVLLRALLIYTPIQDVPTEDVLPEPPAEPEQPQEPEIPAEPESPFQQMGTVVNAERGLKVRSGPGPEHAVIGGLSNGTQVTILNASEGWYYVLYTDRAGNPARGWASGDYILLPS